jgi:hypothetical protein
MFIREISAGDGYIVRKNMSIERYKFAQPMQLRPGATLNSSDDRVIGIPVCVRE